MRSQHGTAITEVVVALLALAPFLIGIPLLGKQLDIRHKGLDAARYAVWERTVWRSAGAPYKGARDIELEALDRTLGDPRAALVDVGALRREGVTENRLWRDAANQPLLQPAGGALPLDIEERATREPVAIGSLWVPALTYGGGAISAAVSELRVAELGMVRNSFASADVSIGLKPLLEMRARDSRSLHHERPQADVEPALIQQDASAILSDTWSSHDEGQFRRRVDALTIDELIETVELPSRVVAVNALGKGEALFGEGRYAWGTQLEPASSLLPRAYVEGQP